VSTEQGSRSGSRSRGREMSIEWYIKIAISQSRPWLAGGKSEKRISSWQRMREIKKDAPVLGSGAQQSQSRLTPGGRDGWYERVYCRRERSDPGQGPSWGRQPALGFLLHARL
jgi:hypothetical protein